MGEPGKRRGPKPRRVLCPDVVNDPRREVKIERGVRPEYGGALLVMALCGLGTSDRVRIRRFGDIEKARDLLNTDIRKWMGAQSVPEFYSFGFQPY